MHDMSFRFVMGFLHPFERAMLTAGPPPALVICLQAQ